MLCYIVHGSKLCFTELVNLFKLISMSTCNQRSILVASTKSFSFYACTYGYMCVVSLGVLSTQGSFFEQHSEILFGKICHLSTQD